MINNMKKQYKIVYKENDIWKETLTDSPDIPTFNFFTMSYYENKEEKTKQNRD